MIGAPRRATDTDKLEEARRRERRNRSATTIFSKPPAPATRRRRARSSMRVHRLLRRTLRASRRSNAPRWAPTAHRWRPISRCCAFSDAHGNEAPDEPEPEKTTAAQWRKAHRWMPHSHSGTGTASSCCTMPAIRRTTILRTPRRIPRSRRRERGSEGPLFPYAAGPRSRQANQRSLLSFLGAPDGKPEPTQRVGAKIVSAFERVGLAVDSNGADGIRPRVNLREPD